MPSNKPGYMKKYWEMNKEALKKKQKYHYCEICDKTMFLKHMNRHNKSHLHIRKLNLKLDQLKTIDIACSTE